MRYAVTLIIITLFFWTQLNSDVTAQNDQPDKHPVPEFQQNKESARAYSNSSSMNAGEAYSKNQLPSIQAEDTLFGPQQLVEDSLVIEPTDINIADMDGDGDNDVIALLFYENKVVWYENDGQGNYSNETEIVNYSTYGIKAMHTADVDGDGDPDVMISAFGKKGLSGTAKPGSLRMFFNDGGGESFSFEHYGEDYDPTFNGTIIDIQTGDVNGDGDTDILVTDGTSIAWFLQSNDQNLGISFGLSDDIFELGQRVMCVEAADFDNDGDLDIVAGTRDAGFWNIENTETTQKWNSRSVPDIDYGEIADLYTVDLNDDGGKDVVAVSEDHEKIIVIDNEGIFSSFTNYVHEIPDLGYSPNSTAVTDLDGDDDLDIVAFTHRDVKWSANEGDFSFGDAQRISVDVDISKGAVAKLDGDNNPDIVYVSEYSDKIQWMKNSGDGGFETPHTITESLISGPIDAFSTDLDGDGDVDILFGSRGHSFSDGKLAWYENTGEGIFGAQQVVDIDLRPYSIHAKDLDGDEDADIIVITSSFVGWYENQGEGSFGPVQMISNESTSNTEIYVEDLDGDGDADVLAAIEPFENKIVWFENQGEGSFGSEQVIHAQSKFDTPIDQSVYAADLDDDGDVDILSTAKTTEGGYTITTLAWYENEGDGTFGEQQLLDISRSHRPAAVFAADVDGDGLDDVLSTGFKSTTWYKNEGDGSFGAEQVVAKDDIDDNDGIYATDLDGDGDTDVLITGEDGSDVEYLAWYENQGEGAFGEVQIITTDMDGLSSLQANDLDGDGDADVLAASYSDYKLAWFENQPSTTSIDEKWVNKSPRHFKLHHNYPNPFNPATQISYKLPKAANVHLAVYNTLGRKVRTLIAKEQSAGSYSVTFEAANLPSGLYIYRLEAGNFTQTRKMLLIK
mgnify:FL=1